MLCVLGVVGCAKHDPILPGTRHDIFDSNEVKVLDQELPILSENVKHMSGDGVCPYRQDASNTIWKGDKKLFSGFSDGNAVKSEQSPICEGGFLYTGLSTGEVIKLNPTTKDVVWVADVFRSSNLTGGASVVDIVAHVGVDKNFVYAGGLGDAFCKLNKYTGDRSWCLNISVPVDFIVVDDYAFVVGTDNYLYAVNIKTGKVYWKTEIEKQVKPVYQKNIIVVGKQSINYKNGSLIK